jgi:hypothetical protein
MAEMKVFNFGRQTGIFIRVLNSQSVHNIQRFYSVKNLRQTFTSENNGAAIQTSREDIHRRIQDPILQTSHNTFLAQRAPLHTITKSMESSQSPKSVKNAVTFKNLLSDENRDRVRSHLDDVPPVRTLKMMGKSEKKPGKVGILCII